MRSNQNQIYYNLKTYNLFNDTECKQLIEWIEVNSNWVTYVHPNKKCKQSMFDNSILYIDKIKTKVNEIIGEHNFGGIGCLKYERGDLFKPHRDSTKYGFTSDWQYNVNIQLTAPIDYTGGEFILNNKEYKIQRGNLYYYKSHELHGVKKITEGIRYCIVYYIKKNTELDESSLL